MPQSDDARLLQAATEIPTTVCLTSDSLPSSINPCLISPLKTSGPSVSFHSQTARRTEGRTTGEMDAVADPPTALQSLTTTLFIFRDNHPFLASLILIVYASGVFIYSLFLCTSLHDLRTIPWLPSIFLTDGILVCCCPLATILPIIFWPLVVVCNVLLACLRWFLSAPTFCGVRREVFIWPYKACAGKLRQWKRKQRRALLPVTDDILRYPPHMGYGAVSEGRSRIDREQYSSLRSQRMQYARQPLLQSDAASVMSVPPPYRE